MSIVTENVNASKKLVNDQRSTNRTCISMHVQDYMILYGMDIRFSSHILLCN